MSRGRLSAIVLNFRTPAETAAAVRSLERSSRVPDHVVVVDNDEPAGLGELASVLPDVDLLSTGRNLGFPGGINAGIRHLLAAGAERVLLLNSDATVAADAVDLLEGALDEMPAGGIVGPVILSSAEPDRVESAGITYHAYTGRVRLVAHGDPANDIVSDATTRADAVSACVTLVDRRVFDAIGLFDEEYFFSFEDVDFCVRARSAGFPIAVVHRARAFHDGSKSIGADSALRLYYAARNHLRLNHVRTPAGSFLGARWREASIVGLNTAHAARAGGVRFPARLAAVARGVGDYARGRFGQA